MRKIFVIAFVAMLLAGCAGMRVRHYDDRCDLCKTVPKVPHKPPKVHR